MLLYEPTWAGCGREEEPAGLPAGTLFLRSAWRPWRDNSRRPCDELGPHLVHLHRRGPEDEPAVVIAARGEAAQNHGRL